MGRQGSRGGGRRHGGILTAIRKDLPAWYLPSLEKCEKQYVEKKIDIVALDGLASDLSDLARNWEAYQKLHPRQDNNYIIGPMDPITGEFAMPGYKTQDFAAARGLERIKTMWRDTKYIDEIVKEMFGRTAQVKTRTDAAIAYDHAEREIRRKYGPEPDQRFEWQRQPFGYFRRPGF